MTQFLEGQLLIATPAITDERFLKSVIFICSHDKNHAMGLVLNKINKDVNFKIFCDLMSINTINFNNNKNVRIGGPMDTNRGFVLHSSDHVLPDTKIINKSFGMTSSIDIIKEIASGKGPSSSIITVGYSGWFSGQLESELKENSWLTLPATPEIVFNTELNSVWELSLNELGIKPSQISSNFGNA